MKALKRAGKAAKTFASIVLAGSLVGIGLVGCSGEAMGNASGRDDEIVLTVSKCQTKELPQELLDEMTNRHPNLRFEFDTYSNSNYSAQIVTELEQRDIPDILINTRNQDLTEDLEHNLVDLAAYDFSSEYLPSVLDRMTIDGSLYYLPGYLTLAGFFYNKDLFDQAKVEYPTADWTQEDVQAAAEAIRAICNHPAYTSGDDTVLQGGMGDAICAGISGTWVAAAMKEKLGDNYAAAKLPTFTVDGEQVQMGSFLGCKILGVNTQTQHPVEAMELAEYLTSEDAQIRRYEVRGYGPSNLNAAASEEVSADVALSALAAQSEFGVSQHVLGTFWTPAEAFGAELEAHSEADLQTLLDQFVSQVTAQ
mgnify:CR=1 FL=1